MNSINNYINSIFDWTAKIVKNILTKSVSHTNYKIESSAINFYVNLSTTLVLISLTLILFSILINIIYHLFFKNNFYITKKYYFSNIFILVLIIFITMIKLYISLKFEKAVGTALLDIKLDFYKKNNNITSIEYCAVFSSSLSDAVTLLCLITGLVCLDLLGNKNLFKNFNNMMIFLLFNFFVIIMVTTPNLLLMFLAFECIFLPTVYFVFELGYMKKTEKAGIALFYWTLCGSFLILCSLAYIYYNYSTLNYVLLSKVNFSMTEHIIFFALFMIGFGVKIPIIPFHFWLLKVHVEAPTGFSIFLSGFLVKSALYCLFMFFNIFNINQLFYFITVIIFFSLIAASTGLATVIDIKKLIAWATIQEMTFMLLFMLFKQTFFIHTCILFILLHGLMSIYMFYLIDIIQRRYGLRSLQHINGLSLFMPKLVKYVWFLILLFGGFPLSAKFLIEWNLISLFTNTNMLYLFLYSFLVNFIGAIFFIKHFLIILYGIPKNSEDLNFIDIQKHESILLNFLSTLITLLILIIYII